MAVNPSVTHLASIEDRRIDGQYGEVWHEGAYQGDIMEISARIAIERREIPVAGSDRVVFRRGRIAREGSFTLGKVDSRFEEFFLSWVALTPDQRRAKRGEGTGLMPETSFIIRLDDPDSWGAEEITLYGVRFWEIGLGYGMGDLITREYPFTWEAEQLVKGIPRPGSRQTTDARFKLGEGQKTWPAAGSNPSI